MSYTQTQWILIFYLYCFAGWIWECCYVSALKRQWINRGFLYGPWLPIYGFGAIVILFTTLPFSANLPLVFLIGMVSASTLEYITGAAMEKMFHMRYWDYSDKPLNINGYICFSASLCWGAFSIILVRLIHPPVERLVFAISGRIADAVALVLTVCFSVDVTKSVQNALDLKELMAKITANNEVLEHLEERFDTLTEKLNSSSNRLKEHFREMETSLEEKMDVLTIVHRKTEASLAEIASQLKSATAQEQMHLEKLRASLIELQEAIHKLEIDRAARRSKDFQKAFSILKRNPSAVSRNYREAFADLKKQWQEKRHTPSKD